MTPLFERPSYAIAVVCVFTLAVFAPTVLGLPDSFPLSTYPMFAKHRGQPQMVKLIATTPNGVVPVRPQLLGTGEVLQAKVLLEQVAAKSRGQRRKFCVETARRLAQLAESRDWQQLELVRVQYDPIGYFYDDGKPIAEQVITSCPLHDRAGAQPSSAESVRARQAPAESSQVERTSTPEPAE